MSIPSTFMVRVDTDFAAWSQMDHLRGDDADTVAGGVLVGNKPLTDAIRSTLSDTDLPDVVIAHPSVRYMFTEGRDTPADVAAAMIHAGAGRALLDENGWAFLRDLLDDDSEDPDDEIIH